FARSLDLKSGADWFAYCKSGKKPEDIPTSPQKTYADNGWVSWGDWLGTGTIASKLRQFKSFKDARAFARRLSLKDAKDWFDYCKSGKRPPDIPSNPHLAYARDGWLGYGDWLGTGRISRWGRQYRPFEAARAFARGLGLKSGPEWRRFCKSGKKPS